MARENIFLFVLVAIFFVLSVFASSLFGGSVTGNAVSLQFGGFFDSLFGFGDSGDEDEVGAAPFIVETEYPLSDESFGGDTSSSSTFSMGMNLDSIKDYSGQHVFVDTFKHSREWIPGDDSRWEYECVRQEKLIPVDQHGWPTHIPFDPPRCSCPGCPDYGPMYVRTKLLPKIHAHVVKGDYTLIFEGKGEIELPGRRFTQAGTYTYTVTGGDLTLNILRSDPTDPIRNIRFIMPGHESTYQTQPYYPPFINRLRGQKVLRFMDMMETNAQPIRDWDDRTDPDSARYSGEHGAPLEHMIAIANAVGADPWFTLPHLVDENFYNDFATIVYNQLDPQRNVYIEWSNEIWNRDWRFTQGNYAETEGLRLGFSTDPGTARLRYQAHASAKLFNAFENVFGADHGRVINVMGSQAANQWVSQVLLDGLNDSQYNPYYAQGVRAEALAIAPYVGGSIADQIVANGEVNTISVDEIVNRLEADITKTLVAWVPAQRIEADKHGVSLIAYEGGQHLAGTRGNENIQVLTDKLTAANRHFRMEFIYDTMFSEWIRAGGELFAVFNFVSEYSKWGYWGVLEWIDQPTSTAPKWRSVLKHVNASNSCTNGDKRQCLNQIGVCRGSQSTCTNNQWPICGITEYNYTGDYETIERSCDSLDNDCDGTVDEGCALFNFSVALSPTMGSATPGGYNETTVTITKTVAGTTGNVDLRVVGLDPNLNARFVPSSCVFDQIRTVCTSQVRIDVGPRTTLGQQNIIIEAHGGVSGQRQISYNLNVVADRNIGSPVLSRIVPNTVSNQVDTDVNFEGTNFSEVAALIVGTTILPVDTTVPINETLVRYLSARNVPAGTYSVQVINADLKQSNALDLIVTTGSDTQKVLDTDLDGIPNARDKCPRTPGKFHTKTRGGRSGCPLPDYGILSRSLTTNFSDITDLRAITNLNIGVTSRGIVSFLENVSLVRYNQNYLRQEAVDLTNNANFSQNKIMLDSGNLPGLDVESEITFFRVNITNPVVNRDGDLCKECTSESYSNGTFTARVPGWSEYEVREGSCGDTYCSITENKASCPKDCGSSNPGGNGGGGGGSGGGGGGGPTPVTTIDLDDGKRHEIAIRKGSKLDMKVNTKVYRVEVEHAGTNEVNLSFVNVSRKLSAKVLELYVLDLQQDGTEDIELYIRKEGNAYTLVVSKVKETTKDEKDKDRDEEKEKNRTVTGEIPSRGERVANIFYLLLLGLALAVGLYYGTRWFVTRKKY